jgi:hypothetical protein
MELGSPATRLNFDEAAADIREMMPSSQYKYDSRSMKMNSFESLPQISKVVPAKTRRNLSFKSFLPIKTR